MSLTPAAPGLAMAIRKSITGDLILDVALPAAMALIGAIHAFDDEGADRAITDADIALRAALAAQGRFAPEGIELGARALAVICAGMVYEDQVPRQTLGWLRKPLEYQRLRRSGVSAKSARVLCQLKGVAA